nr:retrovirus-related Pol polyprotein from transposon TNT 1-94 [Tanacetum cinerariifolium]
SGNSFKPAAQTTTNDVVTSTTLIPGLVTTKEKAQKKNDVKARTTKDETSDILKKFITEIENLVDKKVKVIRSDNGTKFKNSVLNDFYAMKGIRREFSVARTPQQNGVVERRNRTSIEAARTMLDDSKLPTTFWAEAVNTACYVQNRVLVVKPPNKTPYELFRGRSHALSFMKPFGCHVTIFNTLDYLGKFNGKANEGYFIGYSMHSKAFRVDIIRTRRVEENLHIEFLENKPIAAGAGPKWLFDIDMLTGSMNYVPVIAVTNSNDFVDVKTASTLVDTQNPLVKDADGVGVDVDMHLYRSMIRSLMYLTASRLDIMYAVYVCARFQVTPKISHLHSAKRIFRYHKGHFKFGLWYHKDSLFELVAYTDSDYAGASLDRKSTTRGCQFLGSRLISWQCNKKIVVANSITEVEYVASASCCGQNDNIVNKDSGINAHEKSANSISDVNTVGPSINTASTDFDTGSLNVNNLSPMVSAASPEATHADFLAHIKPTRVAKALTDLAWVDTMQEELF